MKDNALTATVHFYFASEVLRKSSDYINASISEAFGCNEEHFIAELYPFSEVINEAINKNMNVLFRDVNRIISDLSGSFWHSIQKSIERGAIELPELNKFTIDVNKIIT